MADKRLSQQVRLENGRLGILTIMASLGWLGQVIAAFWKETAVFIIATIAALPFH